MDRALPFFNWSLEKALDTEPDNLTRARIRIVYTILLFALLKILVAISVGIISEQWFQVGRAGIMLVFYIALTKFLLYVPSRLKLLSHIMIWIGMALVWTNIFVYAHRINLPVLQFVFMIVLSGFYLLSNTMGIVYSILGVLPVVIALLFKSNTTTYFAVAQPELASPGFEIIVVLNFLTIILAHYLFYKAFDANIREKEKLNRQLQLAIAEANKLAASKSDFLSSMSHELRTPLNSVVGIAELLQRDAPLERQKENLKILQFSALDLLSLINNVLDFNKADSDKLVLEKIPFDLAGFMQNISLGLKLKAKDKGLDFILNIDPQLEGTYVVSDPTRLSQLIYNLAGNAIKFTGKGSVSITVACVGKTAETMDVLFSVKDTGIGIPEDKHKAIFEIFGQAGSDTTRRYGGTGLGLAIVKQVLDLFDSSIQVESSLGNGARFFFTIPFMIAENVPVAETPVLPEKADISHLKILIAEDNEINRVVIRKQLGTLNVDPVIMVNGQEAYDAYVSGYYDAVFLDVHMPVMDGYETVKQIRALTDPVKANVYIVAFTASVNGQQDIFERGFDDYLHKPVKMDDLYEKLEKIALRNRVYAE